MKNDTLAKLFDAYTKHKKIWLITAEKYTGKNKLLVDEKYEVIITFNSKVEPSICFKAESHTYALLLKNIKDVLTCD